MLNPYRPSNFVYFFFRNTLIYTINLTSVSVSNHNLEYFGLNCIIIYMCNQHISKLFFRFN